MFIKSSQALCFIVIILAETESRSRGDSSKLKEFWITNWDQGQCELQFKIMSPNQNKNKTNICKYSYKCKSEIKVNYEK